MENSHYRKHFVPSQRARLSTKTADKQASNPHTNTVGREIKNPMQMTDFELMT